MYGQYRHTLDAKGRLFVPSKLRDELGASFYIAKAPDGCLAVYPEQEWQRVLDRFNELPMSKARSMRVFFANVVKCEPDKQGRFLLPAELRRYAGIGQEVTFIGQGDRAEIWDTATYQKLEEEMLTPENLKAAMEELNF